MNDLKYLLEDWRRENESLVRENERIRNYKDELIREKVGLTFQLAQLQKEKDRLEEKYVQADKELTMLEPLYDIVNEVVTHIDSGIKRGEYRSTNKIYEFQQQLLKAMKPYADCNEIDLPVEIEDEDDV